MKNIARMCICRRCINARYGMNLEPKDCIYIGYLAMCPACGELRNIVVGFPLRSRLYFGLRKGKKEQTEPHA